MLSIALVGCGDPPRATPAPEPRSIGTSASFTCGEVRPGLRVSCRPDADRPEQLEALEDPFAPDAPPGAGGVATHRTKVISRGYTCGGQARPPTDPLDEVRASLVATCGEVAPSSAASLLTVEAAFVAEGSRFCTPPSRSVVAPRWEGSLQLDERGAYRVAVTAFADVPLERLATAEQRCLVSVDGSPGDPILLGESRIATRHVRGPATMPIALECSALVHLACNVREDPVPVTTRSALHLRIDVVQVE